MDYIDIIERTEAVLDRLDARKMPEAYEYLADNIDDDELLDDDPYEIAQELLECDKPKILPKVLRDFIEELLMAAFEDGNADAMNDIGSQYYDGNRGFKQDFTKAVNCYKLAAEKGSRQAQENLGYCYYYGRNMSVDYEKAFHYFALGAFDGHIVSLYKIGDMYRNGDYVEKNPVEAFHIYSRCLETMTDEAAPRCAGPVFLRLGNAFLNGEGVEENPKQALACLQKAEMFLYDMVTEGDIMYKKSLRAAIEGQEQARRKMEEAVPDIDWIID